MYYDFTLVIKKNAFLICFTWGGPRGAVTDTHVYQGVVWRKGVAPFVNGPNISQLFCHCKESISTTKVSREAKRPLSVFFDFKGAQEDVHNTRLVHH